MMVFAWQWARRNISPTAPGTRTADLRVLDRGSGGGIPPLPVAFRLLQQGTHPAGSGAAARGAQAAGASSHDSLRERGGGVPAPRAECSSELPPNGRLP